MGYEVMLDQADMVQGCILEMLCNAQSLFRGTIMAKGIPSIIPRSCIIDEIAVCALNTI